MKLNLKHENDLVRKKRLAGQVEDHRLEVLDKFKIKTQKH